MRMGAGREGKGDGGVVGFDLDRSGLFWLSNVACIAVMEDSCMVRLMS